MVLYVVALLLQQLLNLAVVFIIQAEVNFKGNLDLESNISHLCLCIVAAACQSIFIFLLIRVNKPVKLRKREKKPKRARVTINNADNADFEN
jgi:hypothetical protein